ncbi:MAG: amidohydrolase family protein [Desulfurococcaceae archaeon]
MGVKGFINGKIYLSYAPLILADAILVQDSRVLYAGSSSRVSELTRALNGDIINLDGKVVIPGFIDAHVHMDSMGLALTTLDLRDVRSIFELKNKLKEYVERTKPRFVIGRGWDHELFVDKRYPMRQDIDDVVSDIPVLLIRVCGHMALLNTKGLKYTGLANSLDRGIIRSEQGDLTGIIVENAVGEAYKKFTESMEVDELVGHLKKAQAYLLSHGVTTVGFVSCGLRVFRALLELWSRNELRIRVRVYFSPTSDGLDVAKHLADLGLKLGFGDSFLRIMGIKLFMDGSLGARTAWLTEPYEDQPGTRGYQVLEREELYRVAKKVDEAGLQLAVHAIGDKAIESVLGVYVELGNTRKLRHRVEHVSVLRDDLLNEMSRIGAVAVVQPRFIISDWWAVHRLGPRRMRWLYRFKTMLEKNIAMAFSTDAPVESPDPWETIYAAITRGKYEKSPTYDYTNNECLSLIESLDTYTRGASYAIHSENEIGTLLPGSYADFVIVDRDPLNLLDKEIRSIKVLETYVGGERVY